MASHWDKAEKILRIFIPEFSNKVTWTVIVAGLLLTSTSLFERILEAIFKSSLDIDISSNSDELIGISLVILGLAYNIILQREKTKIEVSTRLAIDNTKQIEHDIRIFQHLNEIMSDEALEINLECLETNHAYYINNYKPMESYIDALRRPSNLFANDSLNQSSNILLNKAEKLDAFLLNSFQQLRNGLNDNYLCLHPYWNCDRDGFFGNEEDDAKYQDALIKMRELINDYRIAYRDFIITIKTNLAV